MELIHPQTEILKLRAFKQLAAYIALPVLMSFFVVACGDDKRKAVEHVKSLQTYYKETEPKTNWKMTGISADTNAKRIYVDFLVTSQSELERILAVSRMQQFAIAKLACPSLDSSVINAIHEDLAIWVRLSSAADVITLSICPH